MLCIYRQVSHLQTVLHYTRKAITIESDIKRLGENLSNTVPPLNALLYHNALFSDVNGIAMLTYQITEACLDAACDTIPLTGSSYDRRDKRVQGLGELVKPYRQTYVFWHNSLIECALPKNMTHYETYEC